MYSSHALRRITVSTGWGYVGSIELTVMCHLIMLEMRRPWWFSGDVNMDVYTYHLVNTSIPTAVSAQMVPPTSATIPGLLHAECMNGMTLGSPIVSAQRLRLGCLAMFAKWRDQPSIEQFLSTTRLGRVLAGGWHVRLSFVRRWGEVAALAGLLNANANWI